MEVEQFWYSFFFLRIVLVLILQHLPTVCSVKEPFRLQGPFGRAGHAWFRCFTALHIGDISTIRYPLARTSWKIGGSIPGSNSQRPKRKGFNSMVMLTCWCLWKQRDARVYADTSQQLSGTELCPFILMNCVNGRWRAGVE